MRIRGSGSCRWRGLANPKETTAGIPNVLVPTEAEAALRAVLVETRNAPDAIDPSNGTESDDRKFPLFLWISGAECEQMLGLGVHPGICRIRILGRFLVGVGRGDVAVRVNQIPFEFNLALANHGIVLGIQVVVLRVVATGGDHFLQGHVVVDEQDFFERAEAQELPKRFPVRKRSLHDGLHQVGEGSVVQSLEMSPVGVLCSNDRQCMASLAECRQLHDRFTMLYYP